MRKCPLCVDSGLSIMSARARLAFRKWPIVSMWFLAGTITLIACVRAFSDLLQHNPVNKLLDTQDV